jgi:hypothetical protein
MSKKQDLVSIAAIAEAVALTEGKVQVEILVFEAKKKTTVEVGLGFRLVGVKGGGKVKKLKRGVLLRVGPSDVMPRHESRGLDWDAAQEELQHR